MEPKKYSDLVEKKFGLHLNVNQTIQIQRLLYETEITTGKSANTIIRDIKRSINNESLKAKDLFLYIKNNLIKLRFPTTFKNHKIKNSAIYLSKLKSPAKKDIIHPGKKINPSRIIIEEQAKGSTLEKNIKEKFPDTPCQYIKKYSQFLENHKLTPENFKKPIFFVVKENHDFIKPCPCTPKHIGCGYWIFNLGFGCPFDCSYCYLQQYQNFPGLTLPCNLEDFFFKFDNFFKKINRPIRIGTGEFCDSLALDHITKYSTQLINYFSKKPVLFELKTKSANIGNILKTNPSKNIIISWSLNPEHLIKSEEYGVASLKERLHAAKKIQDHGFSIGLHFDPIIHYPEWEKDYKEVIKNIYSTLQPKLSWISLGTLRFNRKLKNIMEYRFKNSKIVYGELLLGKDGKLRYPEFIRINIYQKMFNWIRRFDSQSPIYLCMESKKVWKESIRTVFSYRDVELPLLGNTFPQ